MWRISDMWRILDFLLYQYQASATDKDKKAWKIMLLYQTKKFIHFSMQQNDTFGIHYIFQWGFYP